MEMKRKKRQTHHRLQCSGQRLCGCEGCQDPLAKEITEQQQSVSLDFFLIVTLFIMQYDNLKRIMQMMLNFISDSGNIIYPYMWKLFLTAIRPITWRVYC